MSVAHSEESSSTTPTSAGFAANPLGEGSLHRRTTDSVSSPASDTPSRRAPTPPLLRPPSGQTFVGHVKSWGASEIANFLSLYKCDQYTLMFHQNDIDGKVLLDLDMASLKEIGIGKIGDRVKLLSGVRELRKRAARPPAIALGARAYTSGAAPEGSPIPSHDHDAKGSQVPKRLATAIVSKRLQLSRPPPLDLRRSPMRQAESSLPAASPSSRAATPRLAHSTTGVKVLGSETSGAKPVSAFDSAGLRPPTGRDIRRSPSPNAEEATRGGTARPESAKSRSASGPRYSESPHRVDNASAKAGSPTHHQTLPRETSLHPFASVMRSDSKDVGGGSRRHNGRPSQLVAQAQANDTSLRPGQPSLEDLRRHLVKFVNSEDGTTRTVNVSSCTSGVEVLERVLKKFGKSSSGAFAIDAEGDSDKLEVDGWGVFIRSDNSEDDHALSESALLDICQGHRSPRIGMHHDPAVLRERGLLLRRVSHSVNRKNMEIFFGDAPPPVSPNSPLHYGVPRLTGLQNEESWGQEPSVKPATSKKTNRASTVSIMSGLGVPGVVEPVPAVSSARSSTNGMAAASRSKRMYNFFGHRPPSELISNHLADYFPSARKRDLEKTVRQSMMRLSQGQGLAVGQVYGSVDHGDASSPNRKARPPSTRTVSSSTTPAAIPEEVETPAKETDAAVQAAASVAPHPPLLPPFEPAGESLVDSLQQYSPAPSTVRPPFRQGRRGSSGSTLSRISVISSIRKSKDKSDTASLLTVDEITAEVENRRASMSTFNDNVDHERPGTPSMSDGFTGEEEASGSDNSDEGSDSSLATSDDEDQEQGRAFTSTGSRQIIKWIKGALIGAGSFGSVFLGMDAHSGLLMAVKQVELPSGDARNEERKRNMVQALEREIELLKELQHENIVQYLDSATDGNNLYIFLEYVPGGSVAALLSSYGAFEEALVRNFSRQILTGLNYLHERNIIHRDIKGANILVDNKGGIKISDFGISKKAESNLMERVNRPSLQGSVFWMAPEVVKQTSYTSKADIWSVGCLVVEMLTGTHPWADLTQMQAIFRIGSLACPATPSDISTEATDFLRRTFEINHNARPTASALLEHPFIAAQAASSRTPMSLEQANATLEAVAASRNNVMSGMPGLGLGIAVKEGAR